MRGSYSTNKSTILALSAGVDEVNLQSTTAYGIFAQVGQEFPLIKGTSYVRDANGQVIVNQLTGLPQTNSNFSIIGKSTPDYTIGFTNTFEYKGFRLTTVADYRTGHSFVSSVTRTLSFAGHLFESAEFDRNVGYVFPGVDNAGNANTVVVNSVGGVAPADGNNATWRYYDQSYGTNGEAQVIDASALKVREISLSYSLPKKLIEKAGLQTLTFGVNGRNLFVFLADDKFIKARNGGVNRGYADPEASNTSGNAQGLIDIGKYPTTKTYGFSVNLTF